MRVFLGPSSIAGIEWEYREGLRKLGVDARVILRTPHPFGYRHDYIFSRGGFASINTLINLPSFLRRYDVFHFSYGESLLPFHIDVPFLKKLKKGVVMSFVGSDIRCSKLVLKGLIEPENCNYCGQNPCPLKQKIKIVNFWGRNADSITSGAELSALLDYYGIHYHYGVLPIDIEYWKTYEPPIEYITNDDEVLLVHAPSNAARKGTPIIMNAINKLKKKYSFHFKLLTGMPNHVVREWLNAADIVIDQISVGWHGKLSVESMALGKPTLCYINDKYKKKYPQFRELPIVNITPNNLHDQLESLIINEKLRKKIGQKSRKYVEKIHDSRIVCKNLLKIYETALEK